MRYIGGLWALLFSTVAAQTVQPSNDTSDIPSPATSPVFWVNATGSSTFPGFQIVALGQYSRIGHDTFLGLHFTGNLIDTDATNANQVNPDDINLVSCDPGHYAGSNLDANSVYRIVTNQAGGPQGDKSSLVFYSLTSNHCNITGVDTLPMINGVFTTIDPVVMANVVNRNYSVTSKASATVTPDRSSFTSGPALNGGYPQGGSTTAIAMIILYSITGVITALFVTIVISGAIRAHRHPERYGPRNGSGRPHQSRAKGIARAMLETLPIVKFGDHQDIPKDETVKKDDIELGKRPKAVVAPVSKSGEQVVATAAVATHDIDEPSSSSRPGSVSKDADPSSNADGSDEAGALGCSICTEDFKKGEEVRVLPCNHKFHPECVDPWLLNVSGTCPLCRISLAHEGEGAETENGIAPPLSSPSTDRRSQAIYNLMQMAYGTREERITALRRLRTERRNRNSVLVNEEERVSRARRLRETLRITTRRHDTNEVEAEARRSVVDAASGSRPRS
ncbi:hypothetical protein R6Q59_009937 [Mikania micrantha]